MQLCYVTEGSSSGLMNAGCKPRDQCTGVNGMQECCNENKCNKKVINKGNYNDLIWRNVQYLLCPPYFKRACLP